MKKSIFAMLAGVAIGSLITLGIMVAVDVHTKRRTQCNDWHGSNGIIMVQIPSRHTK